MDQIWIESGIYNFCNHFANHEYEYEYMYDLLRNIHICICQNQIWTQIAYKGNRYSGESAKPYIARNGITSYFWFHLY